MWIARGNRGFQIAPSFYISRAYPLILAVWVLGNLSTEIYFFKDDGLCLRRLKASHLSTLLLAAECLCLRSNYTVVTLLIIFLIAEYDCCEPSVEVCSLFSSRDIAFFSSSVE